MEENFSCSIYLSHQLNDGGDTIDSGSELQKLKILRLKKSYAGLFLFIVRYLKFTFNLEKMAVKVTA